jgi:hypothetical protein
LNWKISVNKEKAVVFINTIVGIASGYLVGIGYVTEGGILTAVTLAVTTFWSEGINTNLENKT